MSIISPLNHHGTYNLLLYHLREYSLLFKELLGFGAMKSTDDLEILVDKDEDSFDAGIRDGLTGLLMDIAIPWLDKCVQQYGEVGFHEKMAAGFDLHDDWVVNHAGVYKKFIRYGRIAKRFIKFNPDHFTDKVVKLMERRGWTLTLAEKEAVKVTFEKMKADIYG